MAEILIIDDEAPVRSLIRRALTLDGHTVHEASDGKAGMARYAAAPADLVITDLLMDGVEGTATIRGLRKLSPHVPIIAMSGGGRGMAGDYLTVASALGATRTLEKPFSIKEMQALVRQLLDEAEAKDERDSSGRAAELSG